MVRQDMIRYMYLSFIIHCSLQNHRPMLNIEEPEDT